MTSQYHYGIYSQNRIRNALKSVTSYTIHEETHSDDRQT